MSHAVLIIEDEPVLARKIAKYLGMNGYETVIADTAEAGLAALPEFKPDAVLLDFNLPGMNGLACLERLRAEAPGVPVIMVTGHGSERVAVDAMKGGAFDYLSKPVVLSEVMLLIGRAIAANRRAGRSAWRRDREASAAVLDRLVGESPPMRALRAELERIIAAVATAQGQLPAIHVRGETGTGKELVARALHFAGGRARAPFVDVNVGALPPHLVESELFGYERGAFTDARERKLGLAEAADGGTLFLDEIGEMEPAAQVKLLKLLEDRSVRRIGGVRNQPVDIQVITATNRPLDRMVEDGRFRADLYYRLVTLTVIVPSLRERGDDVLLIAGALLQEIGARYGKPGLTIGAAAADRLLAHLWPGNVRELRNVIEQAVLRCDGGIIESAHLALPVPLQPPSPAAVPPPVQPARPAPRFEDAERALVEQALAETGGNVSEASRRLGISRDRLRYRMRKYGLGG